jgi:hypothetical protein
MAAPTDNGWDIVVSFDCTHTDTQGFGGKMWRRFRIEVTDPGFYVMVPTLRASASITRHRTDDLQVGEPIPAKPQGLVGDDWFDALRASLYFPTEIYLEPGFYDIEIIEPGTSSPTAGVSLHPKLGTLPTVP